ncbi:hypothetical protein [Selenomonas ruminantium]|uniref:Phage protein n=1 Tax=Selenomonas ruminantium TaxID=971 RepID=A0A1I0YAW7_SELRU|nr:hypothetical protein [Selenomonas ruminantium]SFB09896.1 hypothetical protein SAMN05216587_1118 [Selenomonas ruminantium]
MDSFRYTEEIAKIFTEDEILRKLLKAGKPKNMREFASKFRRRDQEVDEFEPKDLNFIAFYFVDATVTQNAYMNRGILRIEIYTKTRSETGKIRERIVHLMHEHFDERVCAEGQRSSGIKDIYKYRLEFMPLIFN